MNSTLQQETETALLALLKASQMTGVKAWAIKVAFRFALERDWSTNPTAIWRFIQRTYQQRLCDIFPAQEDPAQSFRRESGDAFEGFMEDYLNGEPSLRKEGIRAVRLAGADFGKLMGSFNLQLRPKDIDFFLQGIGQDGKPKIFAAVFPKASYAERIRADEGASRALMDEGLFSITTTLDARNELGTEARPTVKRDTINRGGFHCCYSLNRETQPNGRIRIFDVREKRLRHNPLISDIIHRWRESDP